MAHSLLKFSAAVTAVLLTTQIASARICPRPWQNAVEHTDDCTVQEMSVKTWNIWTHVQREINVNIRSGYLAENPQVPFRGNIIYFEGLSDSMVNHLPLFEKLTEAGYRVIGFDYMGQGGSSGSMNDTRIYEIGNMGDKIWKLHARDLNNFPKKNIIGWSTGGLAAYVHAQLKMDVSNIVLIAPGIAPNIKVGEQNIAKFKFNQITMPSLTTQIYDSTTQNPHIDPIKPNSPLKVMDFALNLTMVADSSRASIMSQRVNGLVLLSGDEDTYVNASKTKKVLKKTAPHFTVRQYEGTLHEIDNEAEPQRSKSHQDILNFLNKNN